MSKTLLLLLGLPLPALAASFDVTVQDDDGSGGTAGTLSWAIQSANDAGAGPHSITLKTDVLLTGRMRRLIEQSVTITADNPGRSVICGAGSGGQPFWIGGALAGTGAYPAAGALAVTLKGFTVAGCATRGGSGVAPSKSSGGAGGGGGGAGLGGAVFVYHGAVTLERLGFVDNSAWGGSGNANQGGSLGGGGGGMAGEAYFSDGGGLWSGVCGGLGAYSSCPGGFGGGGGSGHIGGYGGFGGGGGSGYLGGYGGFGGGGGGGVFGGWGGFGGGGGGDGGGGVSFGGSGGFGGGSGGGGAGSGGYDGGGGGGMGGAVFARAGTLTFKDVSFTGNQARGGPGNYAGRGYGGALFVCTADLDNHGARGAQGNCSASIDTANSCGLRFARNSAVNGQPNYYWGGNMTALDALPACPPTGPVSQIVLDPTIGTTLYSALDGAGVYRSTDSGTTWSAASTQPTNLKVKALALRSGTPLYAGTAGGVFKAASGTTSFAACAAQPANPNVLSLTLDAAGTLYAGTEGGVFASSDQCATWTPMNTGLPN